MTTDTTLPTIPTATDVVDRHLAAYCEPDADRRAALVADTWAPDGELVDPPIGGRGHAEIAAAGDAVVTHYPQHRFRRTSGCDEHHGWVRYEWELAAPDGTVAVSGTDVAQLDDAGRLLRVVGFFGPLPAT